VAGCFAPDRPGSQPCRLPLETGGLLIELAAGPAVRWLHPDLSCQVGGEDRGFAGRRHRRARRTRLALVLGGLVMAGLFIHRWRQRTRPKPLALF
jgi:hypothetical protein